jgi:hypothetical protein
VADLATVPAVLQSVLAHAAHDNVDAPVRGHFHVINLPPRCGMEGRSIFHACAELRCRTDADTGDTDHEGRPTGIVGRGRPYHVANNRHCDCSVVHVTPELVLEILQPLVLRAPHVVDCRGAEVSKLLRASKNLIDGRLDLLSVNLPRVAFEEAQLGVETLAEFPRHLAEVTDFRRVLLADPERELLVPPLPVIGRELGCHLQLPHGAKRLLERRLDLLPIGLPRVVLEEAQLGIDLLAQV